MTTKASENTKRKASRYVESMLNVIKSYGSTKTIPQEDIDKAKSEIERVSIRRQRYLSHS